MERVTKKQLIAYTATTAKNMGMPLIIDWSYGQPAILAQSGASITTRATKTNVYWQLRAINDALWAIKRHKESD